MKKHHLILFFVLTHLSISNASQWAIETDPLAYLFKGYSLHLLHQKDQYCLDIGVFGLTLPNDALNHPTHDVNMNGFGLKLDYFIEFLSPSLFVGIQENSIQFQQKHEKIWRHDLGVRFGYLGNFGSTSFYWQPWSAWGPTISDDKFSSGTQIPNSFFMALHLRYHF